MRGQETTNRSEIELARTRYEVATVDQGYHVHVEVWEATVRPNTALRLRGGNTHDIDFTLLTLLMDAA